MAAGPNDLFVLASEYLDACQAALKTTKAGGIDRAYVSPGVPAWDCCPQLTVHVGTAVQADTAPLAPPLQPFHRMHEGTLVPLVALTATVLRCAPTLSEGGGQPILPTARELGDASIDVLADLWAIWNYVKSRKRDGTLWAPDTRELIFDPAVPVLIEGGACGWQIQARVFLGGYEA